MLATFEPSKSKKDELVLLGETEEYEPLSRAAYYKATLKEKVKKIDVKDPKDLSKNSKDSNE